MSLAFGVGRLSERRGHERRVFYATPDQLGQHILVDYVANKRKRSREG